MQGIHIKFFDLPAIGFAHHFHMESYAQSYGMNDSSFEIVYVKSGGIIAELNEKQYEIEPGSVLILFRRLPVRLYSADGSPHSHCSVQIKFNGSAEFIEQGSGFSISNADGIILPFITPPCHETHEIQKELHSIVSTLGASGENGRLSASLCAMGILSHLDRMFVQKLYSGMGLPSILEYKIKRYIAENISHEIPLCDIAGALGKSPNYLNSLFKKANGIGIHQYINREKVRIICEFIKNRGLSFKEACESVSISDISYGYRLFKKHMGVTPGAFLSGKHVNR